MSYLHPFAENIWLSDGESLKAAMGFRYPTRMAVIKLDAGGLFVWSPVRLTLTLQAEIDDLGEVAHVVAPNSLHDTHLAAWAEAYPEAQLHGAPGMKGAAATLNFASTLNDEAHPDWAGQIDQVVVRGNVITTEVIFFHRASGTVLVTDLLQQFPATWFSGWRRVVAWVDLMLEHEPTMPRKFRAGFTRRAPARAAFRQILTWPAERVVVAHGEPVTTEARAFLARALGWLVKP